MAYGKWNSSGELTWSASDTLSYDALNKAIGEAIPPIGSIMPWAKTLSGVPASLPSGWMVCDGSTVSDADSPINGQAVPSMTDKFLRGSSTSGGTGGADSHLHDMGAAYTFNSGSTTKYVRNASSTDTVSNLPSYYTVVYIIRFK